MKRFLMFTAIFSLSLFALSASANAQGTAKKAQAASPEKKAQAELKRLRDLRARLEKIPFNGEEREPHKSFLKANEKSIAYNEPAGRWIVRPEKFWQIRHKYSTLALPDDIAWEAAQNAIPGECEGFMNCGIYLSQLTNVCLRMYLSGTLS